MMRIITADRCERERWDQYVLKHPSGIAYQLFAWKQAVENAYGFKGYYLMAEENNQVKGILPLFHIHPPFMKGQLVSLPYCDAGGPLADSPKIEKELILYAVNMAENAGIKTLFIRSIQKFAHIDTDLTVNRGKARMILELPESSDKLLASLKAKVRSQVKKPLRDGLTIQMGGQELLHGFYTLFSENMRDLGSPVHSKKWIKSILSHYRNKSLVFIVRMPDSTPAAGGILLCHSRTVSVPWASSLRRFNTWNPNMLLYWGFLKFATDNGFSLFDFGRSTPGEGTFRFKKQWGAKPSFLHWAKIICGNNQKNKIVLSEQPCHQLSTGKSRKVVESVIMKTPVSTANLFGALTRKYISL